MMELERTFRVPVLEAYGMTEAAHQIACNPLPPRVRKPGSVGVATSAEVAITDENGNFLSTGRIGEIIIRGNGVAAGAVTVAHAAKASLVDGWLRTGDLGFIDADGYLFVQGRLKELINRGGEKIFPSEIDAVLNAHPAVAHAVAFAMPDARLGEDVAAAVVLREEAVASEQELRRFAGERLAAFKVPRKIVFVSQIPTGPTGKLQRIRLAEQLAHSTDVVRAPVSFVAPASSMQHLLAAMCQRVLRVDAVGIHDDFFDLGGDSLSAVELTLLIEHVTGVKISTGALLEAPTIERLALAIESGRVRAPRLAVIQAGNGAKRPLFCVDAGPMFRKLASGLGADQPFLSLYCPEPSSLRVPYRFEDVAAYHVETIRHVQPEGPYRIAGWCIAGLLAYEIAQQLHAQGQRVELLVLFDAVNPRAVPQRSYSAPVRQTFLGFYKNRLRSYYAAVRHMGLAGAPRHTLDSLNWLMQRAKGKMLAACYDLSVKRGYPMIRLTRDIEVIQRLALRDYHPRPCVHHVVLFKRALRLGRHMHQPEFGWRALVGGRLDVHRTPGDHGDMFREPHVRQTALLLSSHLQKLEAEQSRPRRDLAT